MDNTTKNSVATIPKDRINGLAMMKKQLEDTDKTQNAEFLEAKDTMLEMFRISRTPENYQELDRRISEVVQKMKAPVPISEL